MRSNQIEALKSKVNLVNSRVALDQQITSEYQSSPDTVTLYLPSGSTIFRGSPSGAMAVLTGILALIPTTNLPSVNRLSDSDRNRLYHLLNDLSHINLQFTCKDHGDTKVMFGHGNATNMVLGAIYLLEQMKGHTN